MGSHLMYVPGYEFAKRRAQIPCKLIAAVHWSNDINIQTLVCNTEPMLLFAVLHLHWDTTS